MAARHKHDALRERLRQRWLEFEHGCRPAPVKRNLTRLGPRWRVILFAAEWCQRSALPPGIRQPRFD
jgi:hypothetical protein